MVSWTYLRVVLDHMDYVVPFISKAMGGLTFVYFTILLMDLPLIYFVLVGEFDKDVLYHLLCFLLCLKVLVDIYFKLVQVRNYPWFLKWISDKSLTCFYCVDEITLISDGSHKDLEKSHKILTIFWMASKNVSKRRKLKIL